MIGETISHYRIVEKLGEGGMGVVYKAEDTKLHREVAIKILPEVFSGDPERRARFEQEAKLLASLNHPNIAAIYGLEESHGVRFLVLELVPGDTLAERLTRGPVPVEEALTICRQIADGISAAHEKGVIHRDLKPANVKVTPGEVVKVLDFGLAKAFESEGVDVDPAQSPTITSDRTQPGVVLGTAAYMSPEQARGKPLDRRTDIWSFGCLLYEMLTGRKAFSGETVSDMIASILEHGPDWSLLPADTPPGVRLLLRRCLRKVPARRLRDMADVGIELEEALSPPDDAITELSSAQAALAGRGRRWPRTWLVLAALAVVAALSAFAGWNFKRSPLTATRVSRFVITTPPEQAPLDVVWSGLAISRDGGHLAYVSGRGEHSRLFARDLDSFDSRLLSSPGERVRHPSFSPDGRWITFTSGDEIKKQLLGGGPPITICPCSFGCPAWVGEEIIFTAGWGMGLSIIPAEAGATARLLTTLNVGAGERMHLWPQILPDGQSVIFTIWTGGSFDESQIAVADIETGRHEVVFRGGTCGRYARTGHIFFGRGGTIMAVPFNLETREVLADPVAVVEGVQQSEVTGGVAFDLSEIGTLVYVPGGVTGTETSLHLADRSGESRPIMQDLTRAANCVFSPDGKRLMVDITGPDYHIGVCHLETGHLTRLTFSNDNLAGAWTPDGDRVTYACNADGLYEIYTKRADGSGSPEKLFDSKDNAFPMSWSPDGKYLAYSLQPESGTSDIWLYSVDEKPETRPLFAAAVVEYQTAFSPDGRWIAYGSNESGENEIYVTPFPPTGGKWRVSSGGGSSPWWTSDGAEIIYMQGDTLMAVPILTGSGSEAATFSAGRPIRLFEVSRNQGVSCSPDGKTFAISRRKEATGGRQINVVLNWFEELEALVPSQ